jgi:hypothetical protein
MSIVHVFTSALSTVRWWPLSLVEVVVVVWVVLSSPAGATPWAQEVPARAMSPPSIQVVNDRRIGTSSFWWPFLTIL